MADPNVPQAINWPLIVKYFILGVLALVLAMEVKDMAFDFKATNVELHLRRK